MNERNAANLGPVGPDDLKRFQPFQALDEHQLILLSNNLELRRLSPGVCLFEFGDLDSQEFFLLSGELKLQARDGGTRLLADDDAIAQRQVARLRPRQYTATTTRESVLVVIDADVLEELQEEAGAASGQDVGQYGVDELYGVDEDSDLEEGGEGNVCRLDAIESRELLNDFKVALRQNKFVLPSLPEVAVRVRQLLEDADSNAETIAHLVNSDPAIAAKLVRAANSPLYHGSARCESTRNAIVRLGLRNTKQLVVSFAIRDLFQTRSPKLKKQMKEAWQHSVEVAAISFVICRMMPRFDYPAEEVMLAGLLHNIGVIAILSYIESYGSKVQNEDKIQQVVDQLCSEAGGEILSRWKFPEVFVRVGREVDNWGRAHDGEADMCDIVQIAKLHSYMRNKQALPLNNIDDLPAFHKLPLGDLTPELTIQILDEAREQITEARQLLSA